jgi:hypothetical protein
MVQLALCGSAWNELNAFCTNGMVLQRGPSQSRLWGTGTAPATFVACL